MAPRRGLERGSASATVLWTQRPQFSPGVAARQRTLVQDGLPRVARKAVEPVGAHRLSRPRKRRWLSRPWKRSWPWASRQPTSPTRRQNRPSGVRSAERNAAWGNSKWLSQAMRHRGATSPWAKRSLAAKAFKRPSPAVAAGDGFKVAREARPRLSLKPRRARPGRR
jgi:hypothetical protein